MPTPDLVDGLYEFSAGVNTGVSPQILPKNQLADGMNCTVRGTFVQPRPRFRRIDLTFESDDIQTAFESGLFQGGCFYLPDNGYGSLMGAISGRLYEIQVNADNTASVYDRTIPGDPNPSQRDQAWMWQAEKWVIWNDGISQPVFFDGTSSVRSNYGTPLNYGTTTNGTHIVPKADGTTTVAITLTSVTDLLEGDIITVKGFGQFQVQSIAGFAATCINLNALPIGKTIPTATVVTWQHIGQQLPPGRMGTYGMGRNWVSLIDGRQFVASDIYGAASGTLAEGFRDAVLNITENNYLAGGGNFSVPGSVGDIRAMRFASTLDASLGQGPLQVFTPTTVFSCNAPVDRLTWQDLQNPILTESLISNGGLSQWATIQCNGDFIFRSIDGIRSLILARRDFNTWGNVPISREVEQQVAHDSPDLLRYASAVVFDNRMLMTTQPVIDPDTGNKFWRGLIPINFDPISSMRGKAPSVYDSRAWTGINALQVIVGQFGGIERCFAFTFDQIDKKIEIYEVLTSANTAVNDNAGEVDEQRVTWMFETAALDFGDKDPRARKLKRLANGEIWVDSLRGTVDFQVLYRPDYLPCWIPWHKWTVCEQNENPSTTAQSFRPRMGLGEPTANNCDSTTGRPYREAYSYQFRFIITGQCRFMGAKFKANECAERAFADMNCKPICET